jgi:hypothetical protein
MDTFDELLEAFEAYSDAKAAYKLVAEKVPYERGYFCHREATAVEKAKKQLRQALEAHIKHVAALREIA